MTCCASVADFLASLGYTFRSSEVSCLRNQHRGRASTLTNVELLQGIRGKVSVSILIVRIWKLGLQ